MTTTLSGELPRGWILVRTIANTGGVGTFIDDADYVATGVAPPSTGRFNIPQYLPGGDEKSTGLQIALVGLDAANVEVVPGAATATLTLVEVMSPATAPGNATYLNTGVPVASVAFNAKTLFPASQGQYYIRQNGIAGAGTSSRVLILAKVV